MISPATEYGEGLYTLARDEGLCEQLLAEMEEVSNSFRQEPDYVHLLGNLSVPKSERVKLLDNVYRNAVHPYLLNFLKILCERGFIGDFGDCRKVFTECFMRDNNIVCAVVTTSRPLLPQQRAALVEQLEKSSRKKIMLTEKTDSSILDGILLEMDGKCIDGTIRRRLEDIQSLIANEA